jgi:hypothetical protein
VDKAKRLVHFCYRSAGLSIKDAGTTANNKPETLHVWDVNARLATGDGLYVDVKEQTWGLFSDDLFGNQVEYIPGFIMVWDWDLTQLLWI